MKIAFCSSEVFPFAKTGGLADVCGALPLALAKLGHQIVIFLPHYKSIDQKKFSITKVNERLSKTTLAKNIEVYFIRQDGLFNRSGLYGDEKGDYPDNLERFQFYCRSVLDLLKQLNIEADIIHCHDWQTALISVYLKEKYQDDSFYSSMKTLLTIHNLAYQGIFPREEYKKLGLKEDLFGLEGFEYFGKINLLKAGIIFSDAVNTVSPQYAKEIQTHEFGCGLEGVLRLHKDSVVGILNGLDHEFWNPRTDRLIEKNYSSDDFVKGKLENKKALEKTTGLSVDAKVPLFGFIGRMAHQKGIDLILDSAEELARLNAQFIIQGTGDGEYSAKLREICQRFPEKFAVWFKFDEKMAHQIYAGSDFFLMPSLFEPCGLSQMISLRYGTIPIVFKTGGLVDTIISFDKNKEQGNGFMFEDYTQEGFVSVIKTAVGVFHNKKEFHHLIEDGLQADFSWDQSAKQYAGLYQHCLKL